MAITRAQQVRQMLEDGGMLVSPSKDGKRPGYRRSNYDTSGGGLRSSTKAPGSAGPGRVASDRHASANRVAAATNIKSMQDAFGTKDNITADQQINRQRIRDQRDRTIETIEDRNREDRNRKIADAFSKILPTRRGLFERSLLIPGARKSITKQRQAYADYLRSMGVIPSAELEDTDNILYFFDNPTDL